MSSAERPNVGAQIRKARDAKQLSQVQLAERLGCGERSLQAWEAGDRTPRLDALMQIADLLGQPVSWFYGAGEPNDDHDSMAQAS